MDVTEITVETVASQREAEERRKVWAAAVVRLKLQPWWGVSIHHYRLPARANGRHPWAWDIRVGLHNPSKSDGPAMRAA